MGRAAHECLPTGLGSPQERGEGVSAAGNALPGIARG